jgi:sugar phosphate isomerase/epimerase
MQVELSRNFTRRDLLATALAAAGTAVIGGRTSGDDSPAPGPYGPFRMGIQSYSLRHFKLDEALAITHTLGLEYWESYGAHIPAVTEPTRVASIQARAKAAGVSVVGYGVHPFSKNHEQNRHLFDFAKAMGIQYLSADPSPDSFESLDKLVEEYGIPIGIHNHGPGHRYAKIDTIREAIANHHPKIGCCIDTGHFLRSREDPVRAVEVFDRRIYGVHLKDVKAATKFTILGQGDLRMTDLLKALAQRKYNYCLALEYEENEAAPVDDIRACLEVVKRAAMTL